MFITKTSHGYYRGSEQHSGKGAYLALVSWNPYKALDEVKSACEHCAYRKEYLRCMREIAPTVYRQDREHFEAIYNAYEACYQHRYSGIAGPQYSNGKPMLWAFVRKCSLTQCGHFMMGTLRVSGKSITVSGPIGSDGLPLDYQEIPLQARASLVPVPEDIATVFWSNNGWNDVSANAADGLRTWALSVPELDRS